MSKDSVTTILVIEHIINSASRAGKGYQNGQNVTDLSALVTA